MTTLEGRLILFVDDDDSIRKVVGRTLERSGYRVMLAENGARAVELFVEHGRDVALVILDMTMPVMGGPETVLALKRIDPEVRIIGASGMSEADAPRRATEVGVQVMVAKPYTVDVILQVVREALISSSA